MARLIAALGRIRVGDSEAELLAKALRSGGASPSRIADALIEGARAAVRPGAGPSGRGWALATVIAAGIAAIAGTFGLEALFSALDVHERSFLFVLPLFAVPFVLAFLYQSGTDMRREAREKAESAAIAIALSLAKASVPGRVALESAAYVSGLDAPLAREMIGLCDPEADASSRWRGVLALRRAHLLEQRAGIQPLAALMTVIPAVVAAWVVGSFWILYFGSFARGLISAGALE